MEQDVNNREDMGVVKISDEVIGVIAGLAAGEIKGILGMNSGLVGGITQKLSGKKNHSKGVKVTVEEDTATIDLYVVVEYGIKIPDVAAKVQRNVKKAVESMTGLEVSLVNVFVQNIQLPQAEVTTEEE